MKKVVVKTDTGTQVGIEVDLDNVFSEDFKVIAKTSLIAMMMRVFIEDFKAGRKRSIKQLHSEALHDTAVAIMGYTLEAIPRLVNESMKALSDKEFLRQELKDMGMPDDLLEFLDKKPEDSGKEKENKEDDTDGSKDR